MSNITQFQQNCLIEANGDRDLAFTIACRKAVEYWNNVSPGYVREHPGKPLAIPPKPRIKDPVLIEGE